MNEDKEDKEYRAFTVVYKHDTAQIWAKSRESALNKAQSHFKTTASQRNNIRVLKEFDALMMG
jgi:hypothetical protein